MPPSRPRSARAAAARARLRHHDQLRQLALAQPRAAARAGGPRGGALPRVRPWVWVAAAIRARPARRAVRLAAIMLLQGNAHRCKD